MAKDYAGFQTERSMTTPATTPADGLAQQDARFAIDGAIAYGRMGTNEPPAGHWLTEYWHIGRQLAKLGETSVWDNQTPLATPSPGKAPEPVAWLSQYKKRDSGNRFDIVEPGYRATNPEFWTDGFPVYASTGKGKALPERMQVPDAMYGLARKYAQGWNDCLEAVHQERDTVYVHDAGGSQIGDWNNQAPPSGYSISGDGGSSQMIYDPKDETWKERDKQ